MTHATEEVTISIVATVTDDVKKGLELYGLATGELKVATAKEHVKQWLSLFQQNPLGTGLFAVARHKDEVVGFFSIIDIEMLIRGRPVRAGKAEFLFVKDEFRKYVPPGAGVTLPWMVFQRLRNEASYHGYEVLLGVPSLAASILYLPSGDLRLRTALTRFTIPGDPNETSGRIKRYTARLLRPRRVMNMRNAFSKLAGPHYGTAVVEMQRGLPIISSSAGNALVSSGVEMMNMRFPSPQFLKLVLQSSNEKTCLFVFDQPKPRSSTRLVHWSELPDTFALFGAVLVKALEKIIEAKASNLIIEIPTAQLPQSYLLEEYGFIRAGSTYDYDCYLRDTTGRLKLGEIKNWRFTHGHKNFYSWRN
jgi:hypothetical protein